MYSILNSKQNNNYNKDNNQKEITMNIVKIRNIAKQTVSERDYKTVALAQDVAKRLASKSGEEFDVVEFKINVTCPEFTHTMLRLTSGAEYKIKVAANKVLRKEKSDARVTAKKNKAIMRKNKAEAKSKVLKLKVAEKIHVAAVREAKEIAKWSKSDEIHTSRQVARTNRENAEIAKWEEYDRKSSMIA